MKIKVSDTFLLNWCIQVVCLYLSIQSENITMTVTVSLSGKKITAIVMALCVDIVPGACLERYWLKFKGSVDAA